MNYLCLCKVKQFISVMQTPHRKTTLSIYKKCIPYRLNFTGRQPRASATRSTGKPTTRVRSNFLSTEWSAVWWEFHTVGDEGECLNDFSFAEMTRYLL